VKRLARLVAAAVVTAFIFSRSDIALSAEEPALPEATVQQPRAFGYVLGDVITQRVLLELDGKTFDAKLPASQRVGIWLERRGARVESAADGRRWLLVDYQLINAPRILTTISLPPLLLVATRGDAKMLVPGWSLSISPLTPHSVFDASGLGELRPDRPATLIETAPIRRQLWLWLGALAVALAAWFAWTKWRNWLAQMNQPFARAWHEMQRLDASSPQAWQTLHRAFDRTAGRVMHTEALPMLFDRAPHLQSLRPQIEEFFTASSERFFGGGTSNAAVSIPALCDTLRRLERQHER
jgi:mxaA protein